MRVIDERNLVVKDVYKGNKEFTVHIDRCKKAHIFSDIYPQYQDIPVLSDNVINDIRNAQETAQGNVQNNDRICHHDYNLRPRV